MNWYKKAQMYPAVPVQNNALSIAVSYLRSARFQEIDTVSFMGQLTSSIGYMPDPDQVANLMASAENMLIPREQQALTPMQTQFITQVKQQTAVVPQRKDIDQPLDQMVNVQTEGNPGMDAPFLRNLPSM